MSHIRTQLRARLAVLLTGLATTGGRVATGVRRPLAAGQLPALTIATPAESAEGADGLGRDILERRIDVDITGHCAGPGDLEAVLDQIALEVEAALGASLTIDGHTVDLAYTGASVEHDLELDPPAGRITLRYQAQAWTSPTDASLFAQ